MHSRWLNFSLTLVPLIVSISRDIPVEADV
jgi:hypothetical protein